ncbi:MAG TPA: MBL fold metallo-hydrolase [Streptosporangiaceae bacterium]|nr:MBL fold metallo-hydrolase [Streptosporangiaceae bacterium]
MTLTVTFAGSGDAFGSGDRFQACIHLRPEANHAPLLLDCGATSLTALRHAGLDPGEIGTVFVSHLHGDHFGGLPFLILDGQFSRRTAPLVIAGPPGTSQRLATTMECLFPGSTRARRRFEVTVAELSPGTPHDVAGVRAQAWEASHPSGAPALILRVELGGTVIAYTGDTAWTPAIAEAASRADLAENEQELTARRVILTHMSADMLGRPAAYETAHDGLAIILPGRSRRWGG